MIVRPVRSTDLPVLIAMARSTGAGLTSLPANEERLGSGWPGRSVRSAARPSALTPTTLFVLENDVGEVVGISALIGAGLACASRGTTSASG